MTKVLETQQIPGTNNKCHGQGDGQFKNELNKKQGNMALPGPPSTPPAAANNGYCNTTEPQENDLKYMLMK